MEGQTRTSPPLTILAEVKPYANVFIRGLAFFVDTIVISSLITLVLSDLDFFVLGSWLLSLLIYVGYFFLMTWLNNGQTLGKMLFKIRVVNDQLEPLSWRTTFYREVVGRYIQKVFYLLYLIPLFTPRNMSVADLIARTYVVKSELFDEKL